MSTRTFRIPDGPSVADPSHLIAAWEISNIEGTIFPAMSDFTEIKEYIHEIEMKDAENVGYSKAYNEICEMFGVNGPIELEALASRIKKLCPIFDKKQ